MKPAGWLASAAVHGVALLALGSAMVQPPVPEPRRSPPPAITAWLLPAADPARTSAEPRPLQKPMPAQAQPAPQPAPPTPVQRMPQPAAVEPILASTALATPLANPLANQPAATRTAAPASTTPFEGSSAPPSASPATAQLAAAPAAPPPAPPAEQAASLPPGHRECSARQTERLYPAMLRERGVQGQVLLRVHVDEQGRATEVVVQGGSGFRLLDEAARAVAQSCPYLPARRGDQRLASWVEYPVRFALQPSSLQ